MALQKQTKRNVRYWLRLLGVGLIGGLVMFYAGYVILWVIITTTPVNRPICCNTPNDLGLDYESIVLISRDGTQLSGWYIPSQNGAAIILLHGYGAHRVEMLDRAYALADQGYGTLLYDLRGHGESQAQYRTFGWSDPQDVAAAVEFLLSRPGVDPQRIGLFGFSTGGQIALRAAAQLEQIQVVAVDDPGFAILSDLPPRRTLQYRWIGLSYRLGFAGMMLRTGVEMPQGVVEGLPRLSPRPLLFIANGPEDDAGYWMTHHYFELAGEPKTFYHIPEAGHGDGPQMRPRAYAETLNAFFDAALLDGE
ncbi:MAG: alpha/beta fold hydrolase [Anaerolineae bacterium]|nr:alpha/beta fold hydrolase [Anaerolineae bacterium]